MLDLLDLMNQKYTPKLTNLDSQTMELSFLNKELDHDVYISITFDQIKTLSNNFRSLIKQLDRSTLLKRNDHAHISTETRSNNTDR